MSIANLDVLDMKSWKKLGSEISNDKEQFLNNFQNKNFKEIKKIYGLKTEKSNYRFNYDIKLKIPNKNIDSKSTDIDNCMLINKILPGLTPNQAADPILWTTLSLEFSQYANARWSKVTAEKESIFDRYFCTSSKKSRSRNSIGTLWLTYYEAFKADSKNVKAILDFLYSNSDIRLQILERPEIAESKNLLKYICSNCLRENKYVSADFRKFLIELNFILTKKNLTLLREDQLLEFINPIIKKYGVN